MSIVFPMMNWNIDASQWLVLLLYGISATLFSYCISLLVKTPLAAFAATAAFQAVFFLVCTVRRSQISC